MTENNKLIAEFLGAEKVHTQTITDSKGYSLEWAYKIDGKIITFEELKFHSDWNWLMEAVRFINSTHKHNIETRDLTYTLQGLSAGGYWNNSDVRENSINFNSIDDAFDAVYRFAKTWNKKNEN